ncbi:photosynthetic NDH subunit of lumenal location 3, chloroplastic [Trifolium pratense]|uniref:photosynthetic NDH subunit of lumenal location 3, chloroplastic n=1 Tax=Trifolium pratense TaxID=57577 RepID=UPI001E6910C9|nr:photosynthetic NDH subunit of lumenal location 3, chloroplastic [Trifolium pratense]
MAPLTNLHGVSKTLIPITCLLPNAQRTFRKEQVVVGFLGSKTKKSSECESVVNTTRRTAAISLVSIVLTWQFNEKISLAKDNGFWIDGPIQEPIVTNNIANEKTGTRSFIKKKLYMANIGAKGSVFRIKKYSFDLLAMADLIAQDTLNYVRRYLRLKSTFIYFDFDKVISAAPVEDKQELTNVANKLFDNFERLEEASRNKNLAETQACYKETEVMLKDVMDRMTIMYKTI